MGGRHAVVHLDAPASGASPDEPQPTGRPRAPNSSLFPNPHFSAAGPSSATLGLASLRKPRLQLPSSVEQQESSPQAPGRVGAAPRTAVSSCTREAMRSVESVSKETQQGRLCDRGDQTADAVTAARRARSPDACDALKEVPSSPTSLLLGRWAEGGPGCPARRPPRSGPTRMAGV